VSDGEPEDACEQLNSELQAQQQQTAAFLASKKHKKQQKYREWRMDTLRVDDLTQMRLMSKELCKMRKAKDKQYRKQNTAKKEAAPRPMSGLPTSAALSTGVLNGQSSTTQSANIRNRIQMHQSKQRATFKVRKL